MVISPEHLSELRRTLEPRTEEALIKGAGYILQHLTVKREQRYDITPKLAQFTILKYVKFLLDEEAYAPAATILWGEDLFTVEPRSVRMIWDEIPRNSELGIMGAGSMGKSYSVGVWLLLDWIRDPEWTCIKVLSVTEEHAKRNVFAHIKNLHASAVVKLPGAVQEKSIQVGDDDKQGIHLTTIPAGQDGKGRLRGFHPVPRGTDHPKFGKLSRVRVILDEAEEIPQGVWEDVKNVLGNKDGVETIKIIAASNPKDINSKFGQYCEPDMGWDSVDIEESERWNSRLGWRIIRIDGAKCENVVEKRLVYPGLLTLEGYQAYLKLPEGSPEYFTMGRGWFPVKGLIARAFPLDLVPRLKGTYIFEGSVTFASAVDLAFEGDDKVIMAVGRCGIANGWTPMNKNSILFKEKKFVLQIEQLINMPKLRSLEQADAIMSNCKELFIKPRWLGCDRTGNGTGVHDILTTRFGGDVLGIHYGEGATDTKILEDEKEIASIHYDGIVTELFFAFRKWAEFDHVKILPSICTPEVLQQLTDRRYRQGKLKKIRIESKRDYKERSRVSPDEIDAMTMLLHVVRMRGEFGARMMDDEVITERHEQKDSYYDTIEFIAHDD